MRIPKLLFLVSVMFWPIALFEANTLSDFILYFVPVLPIMLTYFFYTKVKTYFFLPLFLIPFISVKLALLPVIFTASYIVIQKKYSKTNLLLIILSALIFIFTWHPFFGQSIYVKDYEAQQKVIRDQQLYPSILLARTFSNKAKIISDKFLGNIFALTDPNNYFFNYHPREITGNQNLSKFPFLTLPFFLLGIYKLIKEKNNLFILTISLSSVLALSFLTNFDRNDFILWVPFCLILYRGFEEVEKGHKSAIYYYLILLTTIIPDFINLVLRFPKII